MTKEEAITLLCEHFSEGLVRTIVEALKQEQGEPVAYFSPQEGGFYWAKPTKVEAPITVDVEPLPLYTTPQTKGCDECGNGGGYALYCLPCVEKFFGNKEIVKIDWDAVHEKLIEVWHRDISADEALDEIKYLIKPIEAKLKVKNI